MYLRIRYSGRCARQLNSQARRAFHVLALRQRFPNLSVWLTAIDFQVCPGTSPEVDRREVKVRVKGEGAGLTYPPP
jgi:hypothetical protein